MPGIDAELCAASVDSNVRVIFTYGSVTHHRQFIYKILLTKLFPVFSV